MKRLDNCCCCVDLFTGGRIIGWLHIIGAVFVIVVMLIAGITVVGATQGDGIATAVILIMAVIVFVIAGISIFFARKLLTGIDQRDASKVRVFKIFSIVMLVLYILGQLGGGSTTVRRTNRHGYEESAESKFFGIVVSTLWSLYVIYVIHSIEEKINEEKLPTVQHGGPGIINYQPVNPGYNPQPAYNPGMPQTYGQPVQMYPALPPQQQSPMIVSQQYVPQQNNAAPYPPPNYDFTTTKN